MEKKINKIGKIFWKKYKKYSGQFRKIFWKSSKNSKTVLKILVSNGRKIRK